MDVIKLLSSIFIWLCCFERKYLSKFAKHSNEINALRRKHKLELDQMVPKKWYDDALRLIEDLKK